MMQGIGNSCSVEGSLRKPLASKPKAARRLDDVAGLAAVARYPACEAQLLQRDPRAMMGKHDGQRRGAALDGFHLQDRRRPLHRLRQNTPASAPSRGEPHASDGRRRGVIRQFPSAA